MQHTHELETYRANVRQLDTGFTFIDMCNSLELDKRFYINILLGYKIVSDYTTSYL